MNAHELKSTYKMKNKYSENNHSDGNTNVN